MNIYYNEFQKKETIFETPGQWFKYGLKSFKNLLCYLGYPKKADLDFLDELLSYEEFEQGAVLQQQNTICTKFYFIIKGAVRISAVREGVPATFALFNEGNIASSLFDFFEQGPSAYSIEAISPMYCLSMDWLQFSSARAQMGQNNMDKIVNGIKDHFLKYLMWFQGLQAMPSEGRVKNLFRYYPSIVQSFKDEDVAGLLGMARETYNRVKKKAFIENE